nr:histidinol-phosphate aminotransferase family protein [Vulcanisaeta sp.]
TFHVKDPDTVYKKLEERGFVLRNLRGKPLCQNCLRATVPPLRIAEKLLDALNDITKHLING